MFYIKFTRENHTCFISHLPAYSLIYWPSLKKCKKKLYVYCRMCKFTFLFSVSFYVYGLCFGFFVLSFTMYVLRYAFYGLHFTLNVLRFLFEFSILRFTFCFLHFVLYVRRFLFLHFCALRFVFRIYVLRLRLHLRIYLLFTCTACCLGLRLLCAWMLLILSKFNYLSMANSVC